MTTHRGEACLGEAEGQALALTGEAITRPRLASRGSLRIAAPPGLAPVSHVAARSASLVLVNAPSHPALGAQDVIGRDAGPAAFEDFLAGIGTRAFRFAEVGLRSRDDALDAVQDAMIRMLAYRDKPATEWTPLFWSVLRSRIIDLQRRRTFRLGWMAPAGEREGQTLDWADPSPDPVRAHGARQSYARLVVALRGLPTRQREAFTLRVLEECDVATTARAMGCSEGSVKTHLSRARDALQRQLKDLE